MIDFIIKQWEQNKHHLQKHFETNKADYDYDDIVRLLFKYCILQSNEYEEFGFDLDNITILDDNSYQGTRIFIIPKDRNYHDIDDYIVTHDYYGSCSGCDTLQGINSEVEWEQFPAEEQVKEYMTVALHLVQRMKWLGERD